MMYTSAGAGYQVDGSERFILSSWVEKMATFTPQELNATGRMKS